MNRHTHTHLDSLSYAQTESVSGHSVSCHTYVTHVWYTWKSHVGYCTSAPHTSHMLSSCCSWTGCCCSRHWCVPRAHVVLCCTNDTGVVFTFTPQQPVQEKDLPHSFRFINSWPASLMFCHEVIVDQLMGQVHLERAEVALGLTLRFVVGLCPLQDIHNVDGCVHELGLNAAVPLHGLHWFVLPGVLIHAC